ncbi:MAG: thioesterase family protein [Candidatus Dormiibacterota bacterium]
MLDVDPTVYHQSWPVRHYELDSNGHVNNAVYLQYAEHLTIEHAERSGFGVAWTTAHGGAWFVHRNHVTYHEAARYGDVLDLTVEVRYVGGTRGVRLTTIRRQRDLALFAEVLTEWVWVRLEDGRPRRVPTELVEAARAVTAATLARNPTLIQDLRRGVRT